MLSRKRIKQGSPPPSHGKQSEMAVFSKGGLALPQQEESWPCPPVRQCSHSALRLRKLETFLFFIIIIIFFIVVDFVIHWNETAMGLYVFPNPIPPPTSLSTCLESGGGRSWCGPLQDEQLSLSPPAVLSGSPLEPPQSTKRPLS